MISFSDGNIHDIDHFIRVWTYAKIIGELEQLDGETQFILEIAAIVHDIACPLCREKYGNTKGKLQEKEGYVLAKNFLSNFSLSDNQIERVAYLVAHHHTFNEIDGIDYQILLEADYIANASENGYKKRNIQIFIDKIARTESGKHMIKNVLSQEYCKNE